MATIHLGRIIGASDFARVVAIKRLHQNFAKDPQFVAMFMDEARLAENDRWIAFYDAQYALEKARWNVLRVNGGLLDSAAKLP